MISARPVTRGDGHATAERLGHSDQIGLDAEMFGGEPFTGAGEAGLHFVGDEENAVLAADILQELEIIVRRNDEAAFARTGSAMTAATDSGATERLKASSR